jgi:hypothetical protein
MPPHAAMGEKCAFFTDGPSYLQWQTLWFLSSFGPNTAAVSARIDRHPS